MYQGKTMLITGVSSDIGSCIVKYFASLGVNIIMTYYSNKEKTEELECQIKDKYSVNVNSFYLDITSEESIKSLYDRLKSMNIEINYLINNSGISLDNYIFDKSKEEFMKVLEVNTVGTFLMIKYFDNIVNGFIFNMSSTDGIDTGSIYSVDYNASKAAINSITKTFSLISSNKIISICPNWIDSKTTRSMDKDYLESELKRIKQSKLISIDTIPKVIDDCIKKNISTGSIIRIEGDNNVREIS